MLYGDDIVTYTAEDTLVGYQKMMSVKLTVRGSA